MKFWHAGTLEPLADAASSQPPLPAARVRELLTYDPENGELRWKVARGGQRVGSVAGTVRKGGYLSVGIDYRDYLAHRLAWVIHYGEWPDGEVDHVDCNPSNNCITNLRIATRYQNQRNTRAYSNNAAGLKGVSWHKQRGKFRATIMTHGKQHSLGLYDTAEAAHAAYKKAAEELHGRFARAE